MKNSILFIFVWILLIQKVASQNTGVLQGKVLYLSTKKGVPQAVISIPKLKLQTQTNLEGAFELGNIPFGNHELVLFKEGMQSQKIALQVKLERQSISLEMLAITGYLNEATVKAAKEETNGMGRLKSVDGFGIYEAKKTELIVLKDLLANTATNNPRQVFAKVPGLNIWESDQAGLQLGVGGRGLSPNRTSNFNTRQNGYDISADALGYPETYYTPPMEALEKIEVVRGAASLQYGTQFGGMLNFVFKKGAEDKKMEIVSRNTVGSFGFLGSFTSLGGTLYKGKITYYTFINHKQAKGWRPNSAFDVNTIYTSVIWKPSYKFKLQADYTFMRYNAQQAGGLTDAQFELNPQQSFRARNWFRVNWNLFALHADYNFNNQTKINTRMFGLLSSRYSLGNLERINVADLGSNRTFISGEFANLGNETRLLHSYTLAGKPQTLLLGTRWYLGNTKSVQGDGTKGSDAQYVFLNPQHPEGSDYAFKNKNLSFFAENIYRFGAKWSITPGFRAEYINTSSTGYYRIISKDFSGNVIADTSIFGSERNERSFVFAGIGFSYKAKTWLEGYANISQNYRAVNFNDLRIANPNLKVDANMKDEQGFSADLGARGNYEGIVNYDVSLFLLSYQDKIGQVLRADRPPLFQDYRFRTNIADARNSGVECFVELDFLKWRNRKTRAHLLYFVNFAYVHAVYVRAADISLENKKVEMAPPVMIRNGLSYKYKSVSTSFQIAYVQQHFTDASNAVRVSGAVNGIIPSYTVADYSLGYEWRMFKVEASCHNVFNQMYFTRRADAYPGPGIIPSDARSFYLSLAIKI
ncbi:MAG: TonB-dependent receptor [Bacteroidia bacterium]|nr:TonB-dependent receptor [Bacteroidia bacterium]